MANSEHLVYGNLACAAGTAAWKETGPWNAPLGPRSSVLVSVDAGFMRPDAHASLSARASSRTGAAKCLVALVLAIVLAVFAGSVLHARAAGLEALEATVEATEVTVSSGDSLWGLARCYGVEGLGTAQTVELIKSWNDLSSSTLQPGQRLLVPAQQ